MNLLKKTSKPRPVKPLPRPRAEGERPEQSRGMTARQSPFARPLGEAPTWASIDGVRGVWLRSAPA